MFFRAYILCFINYYIRDMDNVETSYWVFISLVIIVVFSSIAMNRIRKSRKSSTTTAQ